ncbi:RNA-binding protein 4.1-like isoform X1 [Hypomesus transpacificus]|uniref:RNA-binding protein 4.1-like isoform X1 n=1 Tax=Hypomesus transpacificus TaxID=137520 RepID=UPI001F086D46|nr:RNA-binding protein 4.1-like isoform X1 [Hypomesus transpacificus]XP_046905320.1 RNA-binding protein 4.1-like isoform X1 [Hypomesus transpacificus]XP_046905321.1 RNA-binding protein 4.1-like isoform X1 [Hypomesus transpacificus]
MVKIFIGNLSPDTTTEELRSLFSQYGKISECDIVKNFGFVHMDDKAEADEAIRNLHHYELNGQAMNVELSRGKPKASTKLHVGNIGCTNQELRARFEEYGPVVECDIVKDYAFVHMECVDDAMEAISKLDNTAFQGKLMSVKLSTSRLRTAPGMGERTGCYRCGQEGHWSKECPLDQNGNYRNGSESNSDGYGAPRFGGEGGRGRGHQGFAGSYAPVHGFPRGYGSGGGMPGYARGVGYESAMSYGVPPSYSMSAAAAAEHSMARMYSGEAAFGGNSSNYGAVPAYPVRRPSYEDRDPYGVVDFYEKYRARPYGGSYFEERRSVPLSTQLPSSSAIMRERLPPSSLDPYERRPLPPPPAPASSYYARDRSPIRRIPADAEGYGFERSHLSPVSALPRSSAYDIPRDPYGERARFAY